MSVRPAFLHDGFIPAVFKQVGAAVAAAQKLPDADEQGFLQFSPEFQPAISALRTHAKAVLLKLVKFVNPQSTTASYDDVVDASDECLENVSFSLDANSLDSAQNQLGRLCSQQLLKYEYPFLRGVDNSLTPFVPKIRNKVNARVPLDANLLESQRNPHSLPYTKHPYQYELDHLPLPDSLKSPSEPQVPCSLDSTPFQLVSTPDQFQSLLIALKKEREIAVDLEHHSIRSYQGIVCLMQISTRDADYIVDTLALWEEIHGLLDVFTDPNIVKVFHGADSDVLWLQRDFGLYVVNMFDTGQAARELKMTSFSLAFLLKRLCHVDTDKSYQLADWRVRPLSTAMVQYARIDTHYLLYIYDRMRGELWTKGKELHRNGEVLMGSVFQRSKDVCLKVFEKPNYTYMGIKRTGSLSYPSKKAVDAIATWRDALARRLDESPSFILTGESVLLIATTFPSTAEELLARIRRPSPLMTQERAGELARILRDMREGETVPVMVDQSPIVISTQSDRTISEDWLVISHMLKQAPGVRVTLQPRTASLSTLFPLFDRLVISSPSIKSPIEAIRRNFESLLHPHVECSAENMEMDSETEQKPAITQPEVVQPSTGDFIELKVAPGSDPKPLAIKRKQRDKHPVRVIPDTIELQPASKLKIELSDTKGEPKLTKRRKLLRK